MPLADPGLAGADAPLLDALADVLSGKVRPEEGFALDGWRLTQVSGSKRWYRVKYVDPAHPKGVRATLKTADFGTAALRLAVHVIGERRAAQEALRNAGREIDPDATIVRVVERYVGDPKRARSWFSTYPTLLMVLRAVMPDMTISRFTEHEQERLIHALHAGAVRELKQGPRQRPLKVGSIMNGMMLVGAAVRAACRRDKQGNRFCPQEPPQVIYLKERIAEVIGTAAPEARSWHADGDGMAAFLRRIADDEPLRRWTLLALAFACRADAAAQATRSQIDRELFRGLALYRLCPKGRPQQKNKYRPTLPIPAIVLAEMESWPEEVWVGESVRDLRRRFNRVGTALGLGPDHVPSSTRDFMATYLRRAYVDYGLPLVPDQQIEMWMGHRHKGINHLYGKFAPEYLLLANLAVEAILIDLDRRSGGALFRAPAARALIGKFAGKVRQIRALLRGETVAPAYWASHPPIGGPRESDHGWMAHLGGENGQIQDLPGLPPASFRQVPQWERSCTLNRLWDIMRWEMAAGLT